MHCPGRGFLVQANTAWTPGIPENSVELRFPEREKHSPIPKRLEGAYVYHIEIRSTICKGTLRKIDMEHVLRRFGSDHVPF